MNSNLESDFDMQVIKTCGEKIDSAKKLLSEAIDLAIDDGWIINLEDIETFLIDARAQQKIADNADLYPADAWTCSFY